MFNKKEVMGKEHLHEVTSTLHGVGKMTAAQNRAVFTFMLLLC